MDCKQWTKGELIVSILITGIVAIALAGSSSNSLETSSTDAGETAHSVRQPAPATGPLRVSNINPRYFTDGSGKTIYLTGSHTRNNIQDISSLPLPGGFSGHLDWLQSYNHNFIRFWILDHIWDAHRGAVVGPHPRLQT